MKTYSKFKKFDRKYLFLEYNLVSFLPATKKLNKEQFYIFPSTQKYQNFKQLNKPIKLNGISSYLKLIESTIQTDFILINNFWTFFKIYSKPKLFKFFPDRRSFFCYWIFPFVGFVTISQFNPGTNSKVSLIEDKFSQKKQYSSQIFSQLNWETIEYLNYKNLFLNNYFRKSKDLMLSNSGTKIRSEKTHMPIFLESVHTSKENLYFNDLRDKKQEISNFDKNDTENLINLCQFYLTQTAEFIYNNNIYNDLPTVFSKGFLALEEKDESLVETTHFIPTENVEKNLSKRDSNFKNISRKIQTTNTILTTEKFHSSLSTPTKETILGNYFNSKSLFNFYWYNLNLKQITENGKLKKIKLIQLEKNLFKNKTSINSNWQTNEDFPEKVLPFCYDEKLSIGHTSQQKKGSSFLSHNMRLNTLFQQSVKSLNKNVSDQNPKLVVEISKKELEKDQTSEKNCNANLRVLANIIDLEFKEHDIAPLFINELKPNNLKLQLPTFPGKSKAMQSQPLISYKKANLLLTTVLEKFKIQFGIKLEPEKLQNLFRKELYGNSLAYTYPQGKVLYYLKKVLIASNSNFNVDTKKLNFLKFDTSHFGGKNSMLWRQKMDNLDFLIRERNYYTLTKNYLNLLLLKKSVGKFYLWNNSKQFVKSNSNFLLSRQGTYEPMLGRMTDFQITALYELQKKLLMIKENQLIMNSNKKQNISTNILSLSKNKMRNNFMISDLKLKFNNKLVKIISPNKIKNVNSSIFNSIVPYENQTQETLYNSLQKLYFKLPNKNLLKLNSKEFFRPNGVRRPDKANTSTHLIDKSSHNNYYSLVNLLLKYFKYKNTNNLIFLTNLTKAEKFNPSNKILRKLEPIYFATQSTHYHPIVLRSNTSPSFFTTETEIGRFFENQYILAKQPLTDIMPLPFNKALIKAKNISDVINPLNEQNLFDLQNLKRFTFNTQKQDQIYHSFKNPKSESLSKNMSNLNKVKIDFSLNKVQITQTGLPDRLIRKKIRLFSTNLHINKKLIKDDKIQKILQLSEFTSLFNPKSQKLKTQTVWSKTKIKNFNYQDKITKDPNVNKDQYRAYSLQNQAMNSSSFSSVQVLGDSSNFAFPRGEKEIEALFDPGITSWGNRNLVNKTYYSNKVNNPSFNKLNYNLFSKKQSFLNSNHKIFVTNKAHKNEEDWMSPRGSVYTSLEGKAQYERQFGAKYKPQRFYLPNLNTTNSLDEVITNQINFNSLGINLIKKVNLLNFNLIDLQTNKITSNLNNYVKNLANKLKFSLNNSKFYFVKISDNKKLYLKNIIRQNFYINLNTNKNIAFKISSMNSYQYPDILPDNGRGRAHFANVGTKKVKYYINAQKLKKIKPFLWTKNLIDFNYKPPIEKIFRKYLSAKYNKNSRKPTFTLLKQKPTLAFRKKDAILYKFKKKTKFLNLKITKKTNISEKQNKNLKSVYTSRDGKVKFNFLTIRKNQELFFKNRIYGSQVEHSIKTPYNIIKKIGFIFFRNDYKFFTDSIIKETSNSQYPKLKLNIRTRINESYKQKYLLKNTKKQNLLKRLEKGKNLQKKRRQKKQARLTGRRKKRKRFFPRPIWLRFLLYKKFIKFRHFSKNSNQSKVSISPKYQFNFNNLFKHGTEKNFSEPVSKLLFNTQSVEKNLSRLRNINDFKIGFDQNEILTKRANLELEIFQSRSNQLQAIQMNHRTIRRNIYRTNKQSWGNIFFDIPNLEKITLKKLFLIDSVPIAAEIKFYDISTNLLQDFKKTMWKSYWLRTNFNNYINKINDYLNQIKIAVTKSYVLINLKHFLFESFGLNFKENALKLSSLNIASKSGPSLDRFSQSVDKTSFSPRNPNRQTFNHDFNLGKPYQLRSSSLVNKSLINDFQLQSYEEFMTTLSADNAKIKKWNNLNLAKYHQVNQFKLQKNFSKTYTPLWYVNVRRNFSNFSSIPAGYTYVSSSNLAQFNQNLYNRIQFIIKNIKVNLNVDGQNQLRAFNPSRSQGISLSSNNFLTNILKEWWARFENSFNSSFSIINIPQEIYLNQSKFRILWSLNKTNVWSFKKNTDNSFTWNKSKIRDQNKSNKTNKVINTFFSKIKHFHLKASPRRQKLIQTIFIDKFQTTNNKIKQLGLLIPNKQPLHYHDFQTLIGSTFVKQNFKNQISNLSLSENVTNYFKTHPKHYLQFWWSETNFTNYNFFQTDLSFGNELVNVANLFDHQVSVDVDNNSNTMRGNLLLISKNKLNFIIIWGCLLLLHVCLLFSLLNISQIRTFLKFQLLCVYKLTNIYLSVIYSTFKNLQQLKRNLFLYSNLSSALFENLTITKKSFLLMVTNSTKVSGYNSQKILDSEISIFTNNKHLGLLKSTKLNSRQTNDLIFSNKVNNLSSFDKGEYILLTNFKESVLHFFEFYKVQSSVFNKSTNTNHKNSENITVNFNNKVIFPSKTRSFSLLKLRASIKFQLSRNIFLNKQEILFVGTEIFKYKQNALKVNEKNLETITSISDFASLFRTSEPSYEVIGDKIFILPKLLSSKCDRYEAINMFILNTNNKRLMHYLPSLISSKDARKNLSLSESINQSKSYQSSENISSNQGLDANFSIRNESTTNQNKNFVFKTLLNATNLFSYNFLKMTLSLAQNVSLIPPRPIQALENITLKQENIFVQDNSQSKILPNRYKTIATLVLNKYVKTSFYLSVLFLVSILIKLSNKSLIVIYTMLFKLIDMLESIMLLIYKSLEKPAELMIDFISEFFLIEWSADVVTFIPESFDIYTSSFSQKLMRNFRLVGLSSFFWQRRFLAFLDIFIDHITKPDTDLLVRQKKGIIFWDIWAEVLVQAAEIYSINLSSLFNIKEEQDLFLEKLLNDKKWDWSTTMLFKMSPLMELIQNSKPEGFKHNWSLFVKSEQLWRRWAVNPYYTYQGKDTDLFVESHPPKSFSQFKLMKYYPPVFEPVGNLVCQIYSGTFIKTVSKNLLLVGARGTNKTLLIQAIAGETELKIMIDNANRYALTSKGVAIGMKLLKDVFDALALQAPCLFIIEDIHVIGERRPMLISDDENIKATENSFGVDQEEIHEKNQVIYQLSRHSIVHYKKPYKGDFSLLIPTNHFSLDFFLGFSPPKTRVISKVPQNPLPIKSIEQEISNQNDSDKTSETYSIRKLKILSQIQLPKKEVFSPPSTSPFTILLLKEQKKIKPKKIVSEMPWGGLSSDQLIQLPKASYSVRVKVALLADIAIRNLSVKLDRITDLLIIIDSVRSHRGFVVVATTHIPSILDPALRRPGRFDETLTIPSLPNVWSRWEILKASISDFVSTLDLIDLAQLFSNLTDTELSNLISKTKLFLFTKQNFLKENLTSAEMLTNYSRTSFINSYKLLLFEQKELSTFNMISSFGEVLKLSTYPIIVDPYQIKSKNYQLSLEGSYVPLAENMKSQVSVSNRFILPDEGRVKKNNQQKYNLNNLTKLTFQTNLSEMTFLSSQLGQPDNSKVEESSNSFLQNQGLSKTKIRSIKHILKSFNPSLSIFKNSTNCLSLSYCQVSKWFISSQLIKDQRSYVPLLWSTISAASTNNSEATFINDLTNSNFISSENTSSFAIYNSRSQLKNELLQLFAGKIGEFFVFYDIKSMSKVLKHNNENNLVLTSVFQNRSNIYSDLEKESSLNSPLFWKEFQSINTWQYASLINTYGINETWRRASDLIFSIIYKRCLYNKNILIYRLFNLQSINSLRQPPSPPVSTSFIAAKRYENYKRIEFDFQNRITFSVHEKIQKHQQQRYIKTLYNKPIKKYFRSELQTSNKNSPFTNSIATSFESCFREISLIDTTHKFQSKNKSSRLSSSYFFFNNRINIRHRFYLINQWWNTQLPEHNAETTFLSEIDWRYMFIEGVGDLWMDFPDTDQHYNPRTRQWMLNSGYWSYWYNFEKLMNQEIYYQFLMENFYKAYNFLDTSREFIDLTCYQFLTSPVLKEIDFITYLKRFYKK